MNEEFISNQIAVYKNSKTLVEEDLTFVRIAKKIPPNRQNSGPEGLSNSIYIAIPII